MMRLGRYWLAFLLLVVNSTKGLAEEQVFPSSPFPPLGAYELSSPAGKPIGVSYCVPPSSGPDTPILIVIPGARRNAGEYRDQWSDLATANRFIVLTVEASVKYFPTEYEYNAGGVIDSDGNQRPKEEWIYSAIEPLFDDFVKRFGSSRTSYSLYGHSAGGGFVHRFMLMKLDARVDRAVAANPAFYSLPTQELPYPFGLRGIPLEDNALENWFSKPLVILLGELDTNPRTKPLSNGPLARSQGPHVYARGLGFFHAAQMAAQEREAPFAWRLEIVPDVGHSNAHMASHAVRHLFDWQSP